MPYTKVCPNCGTEFTGRKNKVYCSISCKAQVNNELQQEMRKGARADMVTMEKNERIIKRFMKDAPLERMSVRKESLVERGFDSSGPFKITYDSRGKVHYQCGDFYLTDHPMSYIISAELD
jgi:hypothetical protein